MNLREQEYLLAICKYGTIKYAAEALNISSPALSVFLSSKEKSLGFPLFDRMGKKFVPTEGGRLYLHYAAQMVDLKSQCEAALSDLKGGISGTLRLGLHPRRTTYLLPAALRRFSGLYPGVQVSVFEGGSSELFRMVLEGELDLIVNNRRSSHAALEYLPLYDDRLVVVVSPDHRRVREARAVEGFPLPWIDLRVFDGETFILQHPSQSVRTYTDRALAHSGARPGRVFLIENLEAASQMAAEKLGVAFNMASYTVNFVYPRPVLYFLAGDPGEIVPYHAIRRRDRYVPQYARDFVSVVAECAKEAPWSHSRH